MKTSLEVKTSQNIHKLLGRKRGSKCGGNGSVGLDYMGTETLLSMKVFLSLSALAVKHEELFAYPTMCATLLTSIGVFDGGGAPDPYKKRRGAFY